MAESINIPHVGPVQVKYLYAGGALIAGIVGYAYIRRARTPAAAAVDPSLAADYTDPYASTAPGDPSSVTSGFSPGYSAPDAAPLPPRTNDEWTRRAEDYLRTVGWDPQFIVLTLGKYLARKGLTADEVNLVNSARAAIGPPPIGDFPVTPVAGAPKPAPAPAPKPKPVPAPAPAPAPGPRYATVAVARFTSTNPPWNSTISGIAAHYGMGGNWRAVWNDPANAGLKARRGVPERIQVGDIVYVRVG